MLPPDILDEFCEKLAGITDWKTDKGFGRRGVSSKSNNIRLSVTEIANVYRAPDVCPAYAITGLTLTATNTLATIGLWAILSDDDLRRINEVLLPKLQGLFQEEFHKERDRHLQEIMRQEDALQAFLHPPQP